MFFNIGTQEQRKLSGVARRWKSAGLSWSLYIEYGHRGVEQLVARRAHNPKVAGSSPAPATKTKCLGLSGASSFLWDEKELNSRLIPTHEV
jgi:hypothetical protein